MSEEYYYVFSDDARRAFRKAITADWRWNAYARDKGLSSATAKIVDLVAAAEAFGMNPAAYGGVKKQRKEMVHGPDVLHDLKAQWENVQAFASPIDRGRFSDIVLTITTKQGDRMSAAQYARLSQIVMLAKEAYKEGKPRLDLPEAPKPNTDTFGLDSDDDDLEALREILARRKGGLSESQVIELIKQHAGKPTHVTLDLTTPEGPKPQGETIMHHRFPLLLAAMTAGVNVMLVGPAGSGKTEACRQAARLMGRDFAFSGAIDSPYKLLGFRDAHGNIVRTPFREAVEHGKAFLLDEMDGSLPSAVTPFNAVMANRVCDFPDAIIEAHPDFIAIAACNTYGAGASREYVGRYQQDAAVLDRFAMLAWPYDPALEAAMIGAPRPAGSPDPVRIQRITDPVAVQREAERWLERVQTVRKKVESLKLRHVISPRATITGAKLLAAGWPWKEVEEACIWRGLDADARAKVAA